MRQLLRQGTGPLALLLCLALLGCGSGSGSPSSPYAGSYIGTFFSTDSGGTQSGTLRATVTPEGALTGAGSNSTAHESFTLSGDVGADGYLTADAAYPIVTYTLKGPLVRNAGGYISGTVNEYSGASLIGTVTLNLTPQ